MVELKLHACVNCGSQFDYRTMIFGKCQSCLVAKAPEPVVAKATSSSKRNNILLYGLLGAVVVGSLFYMIRDTKTLNPVMRELYIANCRQWLESSASGGATAEFTESFEQNGRLHVHFAMQPKDKTAPSYHKLCTVDVVTGARIAT